MPRRSGGEPIDRLWLAQRLCRVTVSPSPRERLLCGRGPARVAVLDDHEAVRLGLERLLQRAPGIEPVAAFDDVLMLAASVAQADAVIDKAEPVEVLLTAIRRLAGGERLLGRPAADVLEAAGARLSVDDLPVMALLIDGASTLEIANTLNLDEREAVRRLQRVVGVVQQGCRARGATPR